MTIYRLEIRYEREDWATYGYYKTSEMANNILESIQRTSTGNLHSKIFTVEVVG